jgi:C4-dicarboxylate transporter DctM subunit
LVEPLIFSNQTKQKKTMPPEAIPALIIFFGLLAIGVPIYVTLVLVSMGLLLAAGGSVSGIGHHILDHLNSTTLVAVTFFGMTAVFMQGGGIARRLIDVSMAWVGWTTGGLPIAALIATALFAAINGSSVATALAMGTLVVPAMIDSSYQRPFALGLTAAAGTLGILIPPSLPLILYGLVSETSIPRLFLAGIIPGILQATMFALFIMATSGRYGGSREKFPSFGELSKRTFVAFPALSIPVIVFGGIYGGFVTISEAAVLAAVSSLIVSLFFYKMTTLKKVPGLFQTALEKTAAVVGIIAGSTLLSLWITESRLPVALVEIVTTLELSQWQFLCMMCLILILLGTFLEAVSIILITVPLTLPILNHLGIDPVHYAILLTINIELAMLTPPIGLNLFIIADSANAPLAEVLRGVWPFIILMVVMILLVAFIPELSLWLPNTVMG